MSHTAYGCTYVYEDVCLYISVDIEGLLPEL